MAMHIQLDVVLNDLLQRSKTLQHQARPIAAAHSDVSRSVETQAGVLKKRYNYGLAWPWRH